MIATTYEECHMGLVCHVFHCHLSEKSVLVVDEDQLIVRDDVDVMGAHI
jgi:hypothetical protein